MIRQNVVSVKLALTQAEIDALRAVYGANLTLPALTHKAVQAVTRLAPSVTCFVGAGQPEHAEYYQLAFDCEAALGKLTLPAREPLDLPEIASAMRASGLAPDVIGQALVWLFRTHDSAESYEQADCRRRWISKLAENRPMLAKAAWQQLVIKVRVASGLAITEIPASKAVLSTPTDNAAELAADHEAHLIELAEQAAEEERCRVALGYSAEDWAGLRRPQRSEMYLAWKQDSAPLNPAMADALQKSFGVRPLDTLLALYKPHHGHLELLEHVDTDKRKADALRAVEQWELTHTEDAA
jgi:hypothetical protein